MEDPEALFQSREDLVLDNVDGQCLCGEIKFKLNGPIVYHTFCNCPNCRQASGSLLTCETLIPMSTLRITSGTAFLKSYSDTRTESGTAMTRQFCSNCGSQLFAITPLLEDFVSVFAGSWVKKAGDWAPMREQFCSQSVVKDWFVPGKAVVRTTTNPLSGVVS